LIQLIDSVIKQIISLYSASSVEDNC